MPSPVQVQYINQCGYESQGNKQTCSHLERTPATAHMHMHMHMHMHIKIHIYKHMLNKAYNPS